LHRGGEQCDGPEFRLGVAAMANMVAGRSTRDGRCKSMNQTMGSVDSTACAGGYKGVSAVASVKWHR
jgi:hypothetical protein